MFNEKKYNRKKANQSAELFFAMNSLFFWQNMFSSSTRFSSFFLSCRLAKLLIIMNMTMCYLALFLLLFNHVWMLLCCSNFEMYCKSNLCWVKFSELNAVFLHEMVCFFLDRLIIFDTVKICFQVQLEFQVLDCSNFLILSKYIFLALGKVATMLINNYPTLAIKHDIRYNVLVFMYDKVRIFC